MPGRILLVEDERLICETLTDLLQSSGYTLKSAPNGLRAMEMLKLYRPHLIISDVMMPMMDGITLLRQLKSSPDWNDIPIILLTAKKEFEDRITGLETGADAYLAKPFNFHELSLIIQNLLELRHNIMKGYFQHQADPDETDGEILFTKKLSDFIKENMICGDVSLPALAGHFSISVSGFKRKLKRITGKTVQEFVREFRLKKSQDYLVTQNYNISQVAMMTGFKSIAHFSDAFKKYFGISPSNLLA